MNTLVNSGFSESVFVTGSIELASTDAYSESCLLYSHKKAI